MKIAVDMRMSGKSGIGTFLDEIIPFFKDSGNEIYFSCPKVKQFSLKEIFCFPKSELKKINSCDAYFTPYCNIPGGIKIPIYSTIHDVVFLDVKGLTSSFGKFARKWFYKRAVSTSKSIFTVSEFSKKRILENLRCKKNINVVYNGLPSYFDEPADFGPKENSIIFIGNIKKHKGLSILLEAFCSILEQRKDLKLIIVGSNENFRSKDEKISSIIDDINSRYPDSITFTGFVENNRLRELLSKSKLLVQPSLYEGFGIPPLQALKCGTNAVLSDIEVFKEIYGDSPVHFFQSEDSKDLSKTILQAIDLEPPVYTEKFTYKKTAQAILNVIEGDYSKGNK